MFLVVAMTDAYCILIRVCYSRFIELIIPCKRWYMIGDWRIYTSIDSTIWVPASRIFAQQRSTILLHLRATINISIVLPLLFDRATLISTRLDSRNVYLMSTVISSHLQRSKKYRTTSTVKALKMHCWCWRDRLRLLAMEKHLGCIIGRAANDALRSISVWTTCRNTKAWFLRKRASSSFSLAFGNGSQGVIDTIQLVVSFKSEWGSNGKGSSSFVVC